MHRLFIPESPQHHAGIAVFNLEKTQYHYLKNVIRIQENEKIELIFAKEFWIAAVLDFNKTSIKVQKIETHSLPKSTAPKITLAQCLPKQDKFSEILKACTELGIREFIPVISERTIVKPKDNEGKHDRWSEILQSATLQSKQYQLPMLHPITGLETIDTLAKKSSLKLIFWEEETQHFTDFWKTFKPENPIQKIDCTIVIGPEGGLSAKEVDHLKTNGFHSVKLNTPILRVEHAALVAAAQVLFALEIQQPPFH